MNVVEQFYVYGLKLLLEHHESYDPYIDDCPSGRYAARDHRARCDICKFIDAHPKMFTTMTKRFKEDSDGV